MKVAIDVSPLETGHKVRGVGFYLQNLKDSLLNNFPDNEYIFFNDKKQIPRDVELVHYPYFDPFFLSLPILESKKTVVTVHDLTPIVFKEHFPAGLKGNIKWNVQKRLLKRVDAIITDSRSSKEDIKRIIGLPEDKIDAIYLAASENFNPISDKGKLNPIVKKYNLPQNFILYVGDVTWNKNLPRVIEAVKKTDYSLVLVGKSLVNEQIDKSNPWNDDLVKVQEEIGSNNKFLRLGFIPNEDLNLLYNTASALLLPSLYEGFGLPVLEAMQAGCPVITSKAGSLKEVAGDSAYFVDEQSAESIAEGVKTVMRSEKLRTELSSKGINRAKEFSWKKTADETINVYKKVLNE